MRTTLVALCVVSMLGLIAVPTVSATGFPVSVDPFGCTGASPGADFGIYVCNDLDGSSGCHVALVYVTIAGPIEFCLVP